MVDFGIVSTSKPCGYLVTDIATGILIADSRDKHWKAAVSANTGYR
jgi:hypothetical protein